MKDDLENKFALERFLVLQDLGNDSNIYHQADGAVRDRL